MAASEGYIPQQLPDPMIRPGSPKLTRRLRDKDLPYGNPGLGQGCDLGKAPRSRWQTGGIPGRVC